MNTLREKIAVWFDFTRWNLDDIEMQIRGAVFSEPSGIGNMTIQETIEYAKRKYGEEYDDTFQA